uniref:Uncharacterized protein n=1 Tax=Arundo donax TaxID=35708 RepID=A0A0A9HG48_ARUDO
MGRCLRITPFCWHLILPDNDVISRWLGGSRYCCAVQAPSLRLSFLAWLFEWGACDTVIPMLILDMP